MGKIAKDGYEMLTIQFKKPQVLVSKLAKRFDNLELENKKAVKSAVNRTAFNTRAHYIKEAKKRFKTPTPWFTNAWYYQTNKDLNDLTASIRIRDKLKLVYWEFAIEGGYVPDKTTDFVTKRMRRKGLIQQSEYMVATRLLKKDRYGNIPPSLYSDLRGRDFTSQRGDKKYFVRNGRDGRVYIFRKRTRSAVPILVSAIVSPARGNKFPLAEIAKKEISRFRENYESVVQYRLKKFNSR